MIESPPMPGICYAYVGWFKIWFPLNKRKKMRSFTTHLMFRSHCPRISKVFPWLFHIFFDFYLIIIFQGFPRIFPWFFHMFFDFTSFSQDFLGKPMAFPMEKSPGPATRAPIARTTWAAASSRSPARPQADEIYSPYAPWCWIFTLHLPQFCRSL